MDKKIARKIFNIIREHLDFTKNLKITIRLKEGVPEDPILEKSKVDKN